MRKITIVAVAAALASMPLSQAGAATRARTAHANYATPAVGAFGQGAGACSQSNGYGCVVFFVRRTEHHVSLSIRDQSGRPVYATYGQDRQPAGGYGPSNVSVEGDFCGKTKRPVAIKPGRRLYVFVYEGPGPNGCPGVATQGKVTATFTR